MKVPSCVEMAEANYVRVCISWFSACPILSRCFTGSGHSRAVETGTLLRSPDKQPGVLREIRDAGPVVLVPGAWIAASAAEAGHLGDDGIFVAHIVMAGFITFFTVTGWDEMAHGALRAWRLVLVVGLGLTVAGIAGFLVSNDSLLATSLVGWMVLPALGLAYTGRELPAARAVYLGGALLSLAGAGLFVGSLAGFADSLAPPAFVLVAAGQTAGIVDASRR